MAKISLASPFVLWLAFLMIFSVGIQAAEISLQPRTVLIFVTEGATADEQQKLFAPYDHQWSERHLAVIEIRKSDDVRQIFPPHPKTPPKINTAAMRPDVDPKQFTLILIGKDGTEKFRSDKPVSRQKLFSLVDAMPMRQNEMRAK